MKCKRSIPRLKTRTEPGRSGGRREGVEQSEACERVNVCGGVRVSELFPEPLTTATAQLQSGRAILIMGGQRTQFTPKYLPAISTTLGTY